MVRAHPSRGQESHRQAVLPLEQMQELRSMVANAPGMPDLNALNRCYYWTNWRTGAPTPHPSP